MERFISKFSLIIMLWIPAFAGMTVIPISAFAYTSPGPPSGFVSDFAGVLKAEERAALQSKLAAFEKSSSNEMAIAIIPSLGGDTIENFALKLFEDWKIGKKKNDNGVLLLVAVEDRKMRIEVGYGLEGALTDAVSASIISGILRPAFRANDFYGGLDKAVDAMISATKGEYQGAPPASGSSDDTRAVLWLYGISFILIFLSSFLGRTKSWWLGGVLGGIAGVIVGFIYGFIFTGIIATAFLIPFGLLFDFLNSRAYARRGSSGGSGFWWFGGGGSDGGGGFGGFGGGSSGGGGGSGDW